MVDIGAIPPDGVNFWQAARWPGCRLLKQKAGGMTRFRYMLYEIAIDHVT
jgi:hypothetical protein